jgi:hypothetical protein
MIRISNAPMLDWPARLAHLRVDPSTQQPV